MSARSSAGPRRGGSGKRSARVCARVADLGGAAGRDDEPGSPGGDVRARRAPGSRPSTRRTGGPSGPAGVAVPGRPDAWMTRRPRRRSPAVRTQTRRLASWAGAGRRRTARLAVGTGADRGAAHPDQRHPDPGGGRWRQAARDRAGGGSGGRSRRRRGAGRATRRSRRRAVTAGGARRSGGRRRASGAGAVLAGGTGAGEARPADAAQLVLGRIGEPVHHLARPRVPRRAGPSRTHAPADPQAGAERAARANRRTGPGDTSWCTACT